MPSHTNPGGGAGRHAPVEEEDSSARTVTVRRETAAGAALRGRAGRGPDGLTAEVTPTRVHEREPATALMMRRNAGVRGGTRCVAINDLTGDIKRSRGGQRRGEGDLAPSLAALT